MYNDDYFKVFKCINSSNTLDQIKACEKLCELFKSRWPDPAYILYYNKLILFILYKKQIYGEKTNQSK